MVPNILDQTPSVPLHESPKGNTVRGRDVKTTRFPPYPVQKLRPSVPTSSLPRVVLTGEPPSLFVGRSIPTSLSRRSRPRWGNVLPSVQHVDEHAGVGHSSFCSGSLTSREVGLTPGTEVRRSTVHRSLRVRLFRELGSRRKTVEGG